VIKLTNVSDVQLCTMALGTDCFNHNYDWQEWAVEIPPRNNTVKKWYKNPEVPKDSDYYLMAQFTDGHVDTYYQPNSNAKCRDAICCRDGAKQYKNVETESGFWGSYGECDIPARTFELMLTDMMQKYGHQTDFAIWTGDIPAHDIWMQNENYQLSQIDYAVKKVMEKIPFPVMPTLGNHESYPVDR
jgi:sphingomyelin phosphodiesterase